MEMILAGKRIKEIALSLDVDSKTISTHRARLLRKLNLMDNRALFQYALRHRIIDWTCSKHECLPARSALDCGGLGDCLKTDARCGSATF